MQNPRENYKKSIDSSSFSFLELPFSNNNEDNEKNEQYLRKIKESIEKEQYPEPPLFIDKKEEVAENTDPFYSSYVLKIPKCLKNCTSALIKTEIIPENKFLVFSKENKLLYEYEVVDFFDNMGRVFAPITKIVIVANRKKTKKKIDAENNKKYRECVNNGTEYIADKTYKDKVIEIFDFQIKNRCNIIYIDNKEDFDIEIKQLVMPEVKREFIPKTKKFKEGKNCEFVTNCMFFIPGVSKKVGMQLFEKYKSLPNILNAARSGELGNFEIVEADGKVSRKLGVKQCGIIKYFLCGNK